MPHRQNSLVLCVVWADVASGPAVCADRRAEWYSFRRVSLGEASHLPLLAVCLIYLMFAGVSGNNLVSDS
jgi:hypothetical protein